MNTKAQSNFKNYDSPKQYAEAFQQMIDARDRWHEQVREQLKEHQSPTPSKWRERAEWRQQNKSWLRHSQRIAVKMLEKMDELGMTQKQLAEQMGCSQQYVSKVLKGQENLSLETMSKIEDCLKISILQEELEMA